MSKTNVSQAEEIGGQIAHNVYRLPKKNHDAMVKICKEFYPFFKKYGGLRLEFFILDNIIPMEGITNIADTINANSDDEVWVELQHYRDKKQMEESMASMVKDQNVVRLYKEGSNLITPGSRFIKGKFNRITI
ncbi:MAG: DUF1428 family protein [Nitrososphaeraceae archaeon]